MRIAAVALICSAGCSVDTGQLETPVDVSRWLAPSRREEVLPLDQLPRPAPPAERAGQDRTETRPAQPARVDLAAVLALAGSGAVEIRLARAAAMEAASLAAAESARALPFLAPRLGFVRHEGRTQDTGGAFLDVDKQSASAGAGVAVALQPSEAILRAVAARRRAEAAGALYQASVGDTLLRAAETYFELAARHAREAIAGDDLVAARELLRVEQARQEAGAGLAADVARARARVAEAEGRLEEARGAVHGGAAELVAVLRLEPGTDLVPDLADALATLELVDAAGELAPLLGRALARHPELRAARGVIAAAAAEEDQTRWGWLVPELQAGATFDGFGATFGGLESREGYFVGVQWRLDLGLPSRHEASVQRRLQASLRLTALRDRIAAAVVQARAQVLAARARVAAGRREVDSAAERLRLVQARHAQGADLLLHALDAQAALSRARIALVTAVADHNTAQYTLLRAVGGPQ